MLSFNGESAWLSEFVNCDGDRDKLRSVLRAFAANLRQREIEECAKFLEDSGQLGTVGAYCSAANALRSRNNSGREQPRNLQAELGYPGLQTVCMSMRYPEWTIHQKMRLCDKDFPHLLAECGEWSESSDAVWATERDEEFNEFCANLTDHEAKLLDVYIQHVKKRAYSAGVASRKPITVEMLREAWYALSPKTQGTINQEYADLLNREQEKQV